ncbi:hypothetical protein GCM10011348_28500 [Marinobacterium nitratireducens]|uniref:ParB-like N-terminal domain-containing protein n=1 Tax=Marinobacterium nitratireducens TaxID=518897 RepID=A0A917ZKK0_9GAMM|nr:ParB N-terminal domain-containing protein [Marinobacterium nitratireducens]GGO83809.1 hypothetical protein GCM10011348_28500 [Marinobacterium nitratireducens]
MKKPSVPLAAIAPSTKSMPDPELLDAIVDKATYGAKSRNLSSGTVAPISPAELPADKAVKVPEGCVQVDGEVFPLNKEIDVEPDLIKSIFIGNKRNRSRLRNIEELAKSIISVGRNTEPVKLRALADGSGFELIKGIRRHSGVSMARDLTGKDIKLRAIIAELGDSEAAKEAALENSQRNDLTPWELADQLKYLLESGAISSMEELVPYLPTSKAKPDRSLVYYHLEPGKIPAQVRAYINEDLEMTTLDAKRLNKLLKTIDGAESTFYARLSENCLKNTHTVKEIINYLKDFISPDERPKMKTWSLSNGEGKDIATIVLNARGGSTIKLSKDVPSSIMDELVLILEKRLSESQPSDS